MFDPAMYIEILNEEFTKPAIVAGPEQSIWRKSHRWDDYIFNSPLSFHADPDLIGLNPFSTQNGVFSITPDLVPDAKRAQVADFLKAAGATQEKVDQVSHYTGMISLHDSWGETYGYFEIRARMPHGRGHWPALWLAPATKGWPPEIDIIEVEGVKHGEGDDNKYRATVHFDGITPAGGRFKAPVPRIAGAGAVPGGTLKIRKDREHPRWLLGAEIKPANNIFNEFVTYGLEWTADEIIWTFGPDSQNMQEVFRAPTPPDLNSPLYFIANTEVGGVFGGTPDPEGLSEDALEIDYVKIFAPKPKELRGTDGDDDLTTGIGLELVSTQAGCDTIKIDRKDGNKVILDFSGEDKLLLKGYDHSSAQHVISNAAQVGADVWLLSPGKPFGPQTVILKNVKREDLTLDQFIFE